MSVATKHSNTLLNRTDVVVHLDRDQPPRNDEAAQAVAEKMNTNADVVVVRSIRNRYGSRQFVVEASVYDSVEQRQRVEPKAREKKGGAN